MQAQARYRIVSEKSNQTQSQAGRSGKVGMEKFERHLKKRCCCQAGGSREERQRHLYRTTLFLDTSLKARETKNKI